jgi:hypothetical protein
MTTSALEEWTRLAADVTTWAGDSETGHALLARLAAIPDLDRKSDDATIQALSKLRKGPGQILKALVTPQRNAVPVPAVILRLIALDPENEWPWNALADANVLRSFYVGEPAEVRALSTRVTSAAVAIAPLAGSVDFLKQCLRLKPREQWIPASVAVAECLSGPHPEVLAELGLEALCQKPSKDSPFSRRHLSVISTLVSASRNGKFAGRDALGWVNEKDRNEDDLSAIASACAELGDRRPDLVAMLGPVADRALERARTTFERTLTYQHAEAARRVIEVFGDSESAWSIVLRPMPTWKVGPAAERLFEAHRTLLWLRQRKDDVHTSALLAGPLASAPTVVAATRYYDLHHVASGEASEWLPSLANALYMLSDDVWNGSPMLAQATSLVTALVLVRAELATHIDWPKAVAAAGAMWLEPSEGNTGTRGWVDLVGLAAGRGALFQYLLHRGELDGPRVASGTAAKTPARASTPSSDDPFRPRETAGLARLLRARWRKRKPAGHESHEAKSAGHDLDEHLTGQCALHLARRLAVADPVETAKIILAALAADAPGTSARVVDQAEVEDVLWQGVRDNLPPTLDRAPLTDVLARLIDLEKKRSPNSLHDEAAGYRAVTGLFPTLAGVSKATDDVWTRLCEARGKSPQLAGPGPLSTPEIARKWIKEQLVPLATLLVCASEAIETSLNERLPDKELRETDRNAVASASGDELVVLEHPLLERHVHQRWSEAVVALRRLAEPLPWYVEAALDDVLTKFEAWLEVAKRNAEIRKTLLERIENALHDADEAQLKRVLDDARAERIAPDGEPRQIELLDQPRVRAIGNFWLRRLRFDENRRLPRKGRTSPWTYYGPILFAVFGAPITTVQANYLWQPLIGDPGGAPLHDALQQGKYWAVNLVFLAVCLQGMAQDLRRRLAGLAPRVMFSRALKPLSLLFAINYSLSLLLWWVSAPALATFTTTLLWGTLSLYLGIFMGLLAQGNRVEREDVKGK